MKELPIGIDDFKNIIDNDYFYADKSLFIEEISKKYRKNIIIYKTKKIWKNLKYVYAEIFL